MCATWFKRCRVLAFVLVAAAVIGGRCRSATPDPGLDTVTDIVIGRGNKGPYPLSWTETDPKSVVIIVTGRALGRGEYSIDTAQGTLWFSANLLQDAAARVSYRTTAKSKSTSGAASVPLAFDVFGSKDSNLKVTGVHVQSDAMRPDSGRTIVGLAGEQRLGSGRFTSRVLMSQDDDARPGEQGANSDRSVIDLGGESKAGAFTFRGSYLAAGSKFAGEKEYGIAAGRQQSDFAVRFAPNKRVEAAASMRTAEDSVGANKGVSSVVQAQKVIVSPTDKTRVALTHSTSEATNATSGAQKTSETTGVQVEQEIAPSTSAAVSLETKTVSSGGQSEDITTRQASANVTVKPIDQVAVQASHARTESTTAGLATDTQVSLTASAPGSTEVKGAFSEKTEQDRLQYQRDISVTSSPWKYARIHAVFTQKGVNEQEDVTRGASLELTPFSHTRIGAGYRYAQTGSRVATIADYSAATKPLKFLELSGSYRDREVRQEDAPDSADVRVVITPLQCFTLRGSYRANPEDPKGQIQDYRASSAGVQFKVGSVGLSADVSQKDEYGVGQRSEETAFGVEMPLFGRGKLTTGYRTAQLFGGTDTTTNTYSLGYRRGLGSLFNLSLTGYYTRYQQGSSTSDREEYSAEAALGIRF